ncbi:hypothetical protein [Halorussus lipolyticus]|uniref:hypothetical protein n=1 Tax=Halorussus lipolyticus TaxID=3034024 RepID=UPI0023E8895F|nr:hypothetical protein [Halorussus sp. DT80]
MSTRATLTVALSALVLFAGVAPVAGIADAEADRNAPADRVGVTDEPIHRTGGPIAQYKVSLNNVTIETWLLRNSTVVNATVDEVLIRNATTENGSRANVTLSNVSVGQFEIERGRLKSVTARKLVIRNKSILSIPGGGFIDPNVENRTLERHWTKNQTVSGVVIDRIVVDAAFLCGNATLGSQAAGNSSIAPQAGDENPDITVQNGTVGEALVIKGAASNWSVGGVQQPGLTDGSLPKGCSRG